MSESVLPMFSSRSFIVSDLTFRSLIHFEFLMHNFVTLCTGHLENPSLLDYADVSNIVLFHCIIV